MQTLSQMNPQSNLVAILNLDIPLTPSVIAQARKELHALNAVADASETGYAHLMNVTNLLRSDFTKEQVALAIDRTKGELSRFHKAVSELAAIRAGKATV